MGPQYERRIVDDTLDQLIAGLPAIAIEGAKAVGKTATASRRAQSTLSLDDPHTYDAISAHPSAVAELTPPVFLDEWQLVPELWNSVRRIVDEDPMARGRFLLAGSAGLQPSVRIHSGAGRIVRLVMRPLSLAERGLVTPTVSLDALFRGSQQIEGETHCALGDYVDEILRSGFPGIRGLDDQVRNRALDSYLERVVDGDLEQMGIRVRRTGALMAWLRAYAAATSGTADYAKILNAATPGEGDKPAKLTADSYREHLTRVFLLDPLPAWQPSFAPLKRLTHSPKHHLVDPALAARLVGVARGGLLVGEGDRVATDTGSWVGALFESLATQSLRVYAEAHGSQTGHLRTSGGDREIDLIVEDDQRRVVGIEVKLADTVHEGDVGHLHWLKAQLGDRMADMVVVNTGRFAYRRPDGVAVVPLALLGP
jgi:predicted AAA+ superfamily ATPase